MRRFRGFGVSRLIGISRSICKSEDTANGRMRQMTRSGSIHGHHIRERGVWEDRVSFHDQSANHMMRQFAWSGISREIDKWQDGAISRHCRASRKCCSHICYFSKFLAELFDMFFVFSYSLLIGQVFAFCNFIFRVSRHSMWLVQNLNLKQLHFSFFLANHIKTKLCDMKNVCKENPVGLSTTSRDASVGLSRNIYLSKYKYPFESDETFVTEFCWQGCALWETGFRVYYVSNSITCRTFFRTFCFHLGIVCFCNPMTCRAITGDGRTFFRHISRPFSDPFLGRFCGTHKQANKQAN